MDNSNFKHKISVTVRFNEVDMLGVCNNAVYINYIEHARLQYIKDSGLIPGGGLFADGRLFFVVRNEINYKNFAHFDDQLFIYSKISFIKNSSFGFEHLIENSVNGKVIVEAAGVIVHVDPKTKKSLNLPEDFYAKVKQYEKEVKIIREPA
jgi:YbgC/YbaW family acyl-CoA thioester hydrolase